MKGFDASRAELFATIDKPALKGLPEEPYAFASANVSRWTGGHRAHPRRETLINENGE